MDTFTKSLSHWMARNIQPRVRSHILGDIYSVLHLNGIYTLDNIAMLNKPSTEQLFEETSLSQGERSHLLLCTTVEGISAPRRQMQCTCQNKPGTNYQCPI